MCAAQTAPSPKTAFARRCPRCLTAVAKKRLAQQQNSFAETEKHAKQDDVAHTQRQRAAHAPATAKANLNRVAAMVRNGDMAGVLNMALDGYVQRMDGYVSVTKGGQIRTVRARVHLLARNTLPFGNSTFPFLNSCLPLWNSNYFFLFVLFRDRASTCARTTFWLRGSTGPRRGVLKQCRRPERKKPH